MSAFKKAWLSGAALTVAALSAHAAFYKWVDETGVTHFSENPPAAGRYEEIASPSPAPETDNPQATPESAIETQKPADRPPQTDDQEQAKVQAARQLNCQLAKEHLDVLENHDRIRYTEADGTVRLLSDEEKQAKLGEARKMAEDMCH